MIAVNAAHDDICEIGSNNFSTFYMVIWYEIPTIKIGPAMVSCSGGVGLFSAIKNM